MLIGRLSQFHASVLAGLDHLFLNSTISDYQAMDLGGGVISNLEDETQTTDSGRQRDVAPSAGTSFAIFSFLTLLSVTPPPPPTTFKSLASHDSVANEATLAHGEPLFL